MKLTDIQKSMKAVVAFGFSAVAQLVAFYQANQNLTLKDVVIAAVGAVITGFAVHQTTNKKG